MSAVWFGDLLCAACLLGMSALSTDYPGIEGLIGIGSGKGSSDPIFVSLLILEEWNAGPVKMTDGPNLGYKIDLKKIFFF